MYCVKCGGRIEDGVSFCGACGAPAPSTVGATESTPVSWEYVRTTVAGDLEQVAIDCYASLGYELTGSRRAGTGDASVLSFRRSRKVRARAQLTKIQRTMDDAISRIASAQERVRRRARILALSLGTLGALVLGVGMCLSMVWDGLMVPGIVVGVLGILGCAGTWFAYRSALDAESRKAAPGIEAAYDSLATACEEAQTLSRSR